MRILFLCHYFPPEVNAPATRTHEHCKIWAAKGHDITVVCCVPHHPMGKAYPGFKNKLWQIDTVDGIRVVRVLTYVTANEGLLKRTLNYVLYMLMAILVAPFLGKVDLVVSTSPQFFCGLAGYFVSRLKRVPWVLEVRDLWPESILSVGAITNKWVIRALEWVERFVYRKANYIVVVTQSFKVHILARGGVPDRIAVIRNGVDLSLYEPQTKNSELARRLGVEGKFVASYVGTHGMAHGLDILLDAAAMLRDRADIVILTLGEGSEYRRLKDAVAARGLNNLKMLGQQPKHLMPAYWSIADASLVLLRKLDLFETVIPSKIFESMAMSKPIILGVRGEVEALLREAQCGVFIEPESAEQLAAALLALADSSQQVDDLGHNGRVFVQQNFDRAMLAEEFEAVLYKACDKCVTPAAPA